MNYILKFISTMIRIHRLLFCKLFQSWPLLSGSKRVLLVVPHAYDLVSDHYVLHPAHCYWLGATHHCPVVDDQKHPEHSKIRKSRQREGSLQIQTLPHTSSGSYERGRGVIFVCVHTLFLGKSYLLCLELMNTLVSSGFSHYQDTLQTGSIIKLYNMINIDIDQYRENYYDHIFCHIAQPYMQKQKKEIWGW